MLTSEESFKIDSALLTSRDKFAARVALYALRILQQIAQTHPAVQESLLTPVEIHHWLAQSEDSRVLIQDQGLEWDETFLDFWTKLIDSAQRSLQTIAQHQGVPLLNLTIDQVIAGFEAQAKAALQSLQ
jgi:lysophospholipase L1-like esterase